MNVLVVAAHPDDEVLGTGGVIARHAEHGDRVTIAILGEGITSRSASRQATVGSDLDDLHQNAHEASRILGCPDVRLCGLPDNRFDSLDLIDVVKVVEGLVRDVKPEIIYTHHHGDLNVDHTVTARAVLTAVRPLPGGTVRRILAFEVSSSTGWGHLEFSFVPTVFVDISATLQRKIDAMNVYRSEIREWPHARSGEALAHRARAWGSQVGLAAAEPFVLLREVVSP